MTNKKNFIKKNDGFICQNCGTANSPAPTTCRNHCTNCLYSLHVDLNIPGDRQNPCQGLMHPIQVQQNGKKGFFLVHQCQKCGQKVNNIVLDDDNWENVCKVNVSALF